MMLDEVLKGLECCNLWDEKCEECPFHNIPNCIDSLKMESINLIKRQNAEKEKLQKEIDELKLKKS